MKRKIVSIICSIIMIASLVMFAGCSGGGSSGSGNTGISGSGE